MTQPRALRNVIAGECVDARSDVRSESVNPATAQVVATAALSRAADVGAANAAASAAFDVWGRSTPSERQQVITVQKLADENEAVRLANGVDYGLASSFWTTDFGTAMRMTKRLDFGCVWVNTHVPVVAEMPHGGFKRSGYGKDLSDLSMYGLEDYTRIKHVMANIES